MLSRLLLIVGLLVPSASMAQPFEPGPTTSVPGSSMSGMRIDGMPPPLGGVRIKGAHVFGETVEQRAYGRDYDNSYLHPRIPKGGGRPEMTTEERAMEGRSDLNGINAESFARGGPNAIGKSSVTHGGSVGSHRAIIRRSRGDR